MKGDIEEQLMYDIQRTSGELTSNDKTDVERDLIGSSILEDNATKCEHHIFISLITQGNHVHTDEHK